MGRRPDVVWTDLYRELTRLKKTELLEILGLAFEALPRTRLPDVFGDQVDLDTIGGMRKSISGGTLLKKVRQFHQDSLNGRHRQGFNVNSRNYREVSDGTKTWIAEVNALFSQAIVASEDGHPRHVREAMDLLFDLLNRIDDGEDFIFFADEQGSWQVGVEYKKVFPAYFKVLATTADAKEYGDRVHELITLFERYNKDNHLKVAKKIATPAQRTALGRGSMKKKGRP